MKCIVVNKYKTDYDIDIQRGTKWGNPYKDMPRVLAIENYKRLFLEWMRTGYVTVDELRSMAGKRLGCTCFPQPCHGDVIARAANIVNGIKETNLDFLEI